MKKYLKIGYIFLGIGLIIFIVTSTYGRYIYYELKDYYLATKNFYFNSDKLTLHKTTYQVENWSGVDTYVIPFYLNSYKNNLEACDSDIEYDIEYVCSTNVNCSLNKTSGTIFSNNNTDNLVATLSPVTSLSEGDQAFIEIKATSTSPYEKEISARFVLNVLTIGLSYEIIDESNRPYLNFDITNTLDYYVISEAFGSYAVGDRIDFDTFNSLSAAEKSKCRSALITLTFDPNVVVLDLTSPAYLRAIDQTTTTIDGYQYINSLTFNIDPISSEIVKFYKVDATRNYTYPIVNPTPIIQFSYS